MSTVEPLDEQLLDVLRSEEFTANARSILEQEPAMPAVDVDDLLEQLPELAAERFAQAEQAEPSLGDLLPQIGGREPPAEPVELMLSPDLSPPVALQAMKEERATVALIPTDHGAWYVPRAALETATAESRNAFRQYLEEALAAAVGPSVLPDPIRALVKEAWSTAVWARTGQMVRYRCLGTPGHKFSGPPGAEWCAWGTAHNGRQRARVVVDMD